jgi:hypothetical protein
MTSSAQTRKWSIQVNYDAQDDNGKKVRARSVFQTEAEDIGQAYANAEKTFAGRTDVKLGAIVPGHHMIIP